MKYSKRQWNRDIEPVIKLKDRTTMATIAKELRKRTREKVHMPNLRSWMHPDREKLTQPLYGTGSILLEIGWEMIRK